jgi:hypothetical protein
MHVALLLSLRLEHLEAEAQIRHVLFRYARGCDRADAGMLAQCFWPESTPHVSSALLALCRTLHLAFGRECGGAAV